MLSARSFANSYVGPQALAELMAHQSTTFNPNKQLAAEYLEIACRRGLPDDAHQTLQHAVEKCVEPKDDSWWQWLWNSFNY